MRAANDIANDMGHFVPNVGHFVPSNKLRVVKYIFD